MDESLWPARNVAEYAYCPRLFYYMQVEDAFIPSSDTESIQYLGAAIHRRVDRPSLEKTKKQSQLPISERPQIVRSLVLTSSSLGLTATLDLAEISGSTAVPVEYRKGRPKNAGGNIQPEPWPVDRVQVGLQAILLKEAGYEVKEAVIYYAEPKIRLPLIVDEHLTHEALEVFERARECAKGPRPLPLVNDPRCVRCSLQPVCLPDEINDCRAQSLESSMPRKRAWPPRQDGVEMLAQKDGIKIGISGRELRVKDQDRSVVKSLPLVNLDRLTILGDVQISTQAICALMKEKIPIALLSSSGKLVTLMEPSSSVNANLRKAQVYKFDRQDLSLEFSRALISAKISNQRKLLLRNHKELPKQVADEMAEAAKKAAEASSLDAIRGYEGRAAALYFGNFAGMIKTPMAKEFEKNGRQRRPAPDPVNAFLSFGYHYLTANVISALRLASLEPAIGVFHVSKPARPALALDLMEPFRPLIVDSMTILCFNRLEITDGHFIRTASGCSLTDVGRRNFFKAFQRRMEEEITHPVLEYRLSYRRMIVFHAQMIAAWLMDEIPSLDFLKTR